MAVNISFDSTCYYRILGLCKQATNNEIRHAYRSLALMDKRPGISKEAKRRFQQIQEAYSVLSNKGKRSVYDAGIYDLLSDDDDELEVLLKVADYGIVLVHTFGDFMQEMAPTIKRTRCQQDGNNLEELQKMLIEMIDCDYTSNVSRKKTRTS